MRKFASLMVLAATLFTAGQALAIGQLGVRLGTGTSMPDKIDGDPDIAPFAIGAGWKMSIVAVEIEADALYWMNSWSQGGLDYSENRLAFPVMGKFSFPLVPLLLDASLGLGLEPRFLLSAEAGGTDVKDNMESMVLYMPFILGGTLDLKVISANVEMRYERQLTANAKSPADEGRIHQLMFFAGLFF